MHLERANIIKGSACEINMREVKIMPLRPWHPWREINLLREDFNRILERFPYADRPTTFVPKIDLYNLDGEIVASAELPGIDARDDLEVIVSEDSLHVAGEIKTAAEINREDYYHSERYYGRFSRTIPLPQEVDPAGSRATYRNGVLEVRMPKVAPDKQKSRRLEIQ